MVDCTRETLHGWLAVRLAERAVRVGVEQRVYGGHGAERKSGRKAEK